MAAWDFAFDTTPFDCNLIYNSNISVHSFVNVISAVSYILLQITTIMVFA